MLLTEPKEPTPRGRRARRTPPPAPPLAATPFEGAAVLEELPGPLDGMLWQAARDVDLWLKLLPQDRKDLFGAEYAEHVEWDRETDPELLDALEVFTAMRSQPEAVTRKRLLRACEHCYNWATRNSYLRTAVTFAELCASGAPEDANRHTAAGRANRQLGAFERAARWFDRAIALARVQGDQAALADALLTWGVSAFKRADYNAARKLFMRAWRRGKRFNLREVGAFARHNLLLLELPLENFAAAGEHGAAALQLYGPRHPRLPFLAHDLALLWSTEGYYGIALQLLLASRPRITPENEQLKAWANIGRAAAGAGRADLFYDAWHRVTRESGNSSSPDLPEALAVIADGAHLLGRTSQATEVAAQAVQLARRRRDADAERLALAALERFRAGDRGPPATNPPASVHALATRIERALSR